VLLFLLVLPKASSLLNYFLYSWIILLCSIYEFIHLRIYNRQIFSFSFSLITKQFHYSVKTIIVIRLKTDLLSYLYCKNLEYYEPIIFEFNHLLHFWNFEYLPFQCLFIDLGSRFHHSKNLLYLNLSFGSDLLLRCCCYQVRIVIISFYPFFFAFFSIFFSPLHLK
jgi:hypothetical protein